ncbi:restriction endonuclease subunit S [Nonomuraea sp. NPDC049480]|uniref:restriction endonuclease subunit S n=1 Tax=Nonomuraea sp. NPDC049480 TaxID=3364353 RepID=UPI0037B24010
MPETWIESTLGDQLREKPRNGYSPKEVASWTGTLALGLACISSTGFSPTQLKNVPSRDRRNLQALLHDGDLLITRANTRNLVGLVGRYRDIGNPCIYPDLMMRLVPAHSVTPDFFEVLLRSATVRRQIQAISQGTSESMAKISGTSIAKVCLLIPPANEQRWITKILDALDSQITFTESRIRKTVTIRLGLAHDLIPVSSDPLLLGDEWELIPLAEVVPSADYGISTALEGDETGTPTLRMNNLSGGRIRLHEVKYSPASVPGHLILRDRDVLFNRTNSIDHVGRTSIWRNEISRPTTFASYLVRLNPNLDRLHPEYLVRWLNQPAIQQRIRRYATPGVHQVNINPTNLRRTLIELPTDLSIQRKINDVLTESERTIDQLRQEASRLQMLKAGLMEDLLTGRVRVSEAEAVLEGLSP